MTEPIGWAWWTGRTEGEEVARHLLPVGVPPGLGLRFDPDLWTTNPPFPDQCPIAVTMNRRPRYDRYLFLNPSVGTVAMQLEPGGRETILVNSSVATLVSSIGVYGAWHSRLVATREDQTIVTALAAEAADQLDALERAATHHDELPKFWRNEVRSLGSML